MDQVCPRVTCCRLEPSPLLRPSLNTALALYTRLHSLLLPLSTHPASSADPELTLPPFYSDFAVLPRLKEFVNVTRNNG